MSSPGFEVCLKVDTRARAVLLAWHCSACLAGLLIVAAIQQPLLLTLPLGLVWAAVSVARLVQARSGFQRVAALRFDAAGALSIVDPDNGVVQASLLQGSRVLAGFAWFRMVAEDGQKLTELLFAGSQADWDWRRLHILWRLGNTFIGATGRN